MEYSNFDIDGILASMTLLVDSREQPTKRLTDRLEIIGLPHETAKLNVGDYSCKTTLPDGSILDFSSQVVIDRRKFKNSFFRGNKECQLCWIMH